MAVLLLLVLSRRLLTPPCYGRWQRLVHCCPQRQRRQDPESGKAAQRGCWWWGRWSSKRPLGLLCRPHIGLERQGPGSGQGQRQALSHLFDFLLCYAFWGGSQRFRKVWDAGRMTFLLIYRRNLTLWRRVMAKTNQKFEFLM